jgi:hypothetical protein
VILRCFGGHREREIETAQRSTGFAPDDTDLDVIVRMPSRIERIRPPTTKDQNALTGSIELRRAPSLTSRTREATVSPL